MFVKDFGIDTSESDWQSPKAEYPTEVTDEGIVTFSNEVHFAKTNGAIDVIDDRIDTSFNELQPQKALLPIEFTDSGINNDSSALQL